MTSMKKNDMNKIEKLNCRTELNAISILEEVIATKAPSIIKMLCLLLTAFLVKSNRNAILKDNLFTHFPSRHRI